MGLENSDGGFALHAGSVTQAGTGLEGEDLVRLLCALSELPEGTARGFAPAAGSFIGLFAVHHRGQIRVYLNSCPHIGVALDWSPNQFLNATGERIICATHGAEFRIEDGEALSGPCLGDRLTKIACTIANGGLYVSEDAGL